MKNAVFWPERDFASLCRGEPGIEKQAQAHADFYW
jgi:hypothetical protein